MDRVQARRIRLEQCEACANIRARFGLRAAFEYLVLEKLTTSAETAVRRPEFARELPAFVSAVRQLLSSGELHSEFARLEAEIAQPDLESIVLAGGTDGDDALDEPPTVALDRIARFEMIKQLLLASQLGVS